MARTAGSTTPKKLAEALQKREPESSLYAVVGGESYLRYHTFRTIQRAMTEPAVYRLDGDETDPDQLRKLCYGRDLSDARQLVVLENTGARRSWTKQEKKRDALTEYCQNPNPDTVLVVASEKIPGNLKLAKMLRKAGVWVACDPFPMPQLQAWLIRQAAKREVELSPARARQVIGLVGPDMQRLLSEITKLSVWLGDAGHTPEAKDLRDVLSRSGHSVAFDLFEHIGAGHTAAAVECVHDLILSNESPYALIGLMNYRVRQHWKAAGLESQGRSTAAAVKAIRMPPFARSAFTRTQHRLNLDRCRRLHDLLMTADYKAGDLKAAANLEWFVIRACQIVADGIPG